MTLYNQLTLQSNPYPHQDRPETTRDTTLKYRDTYNQCSQQPAGALWTIYNSILAFD